MDILPIPIPHISVASWVKTGLPPTKMVGFAACHGPIGTMEQGCGVKTPNAAAVAAATCGFAMEQHIPKGVILLPSAISVIVATGLEHPKVVTCEVAFNVPGFVPKGHINFAPLTTTAPIKPPLLHVQLCELLKKYLPHENLLPDNMFDHLLHISQYTLHFRHSILSKDIPLDA